MTDGFMLKSYYNVPIIIDRYPDNSRLRAIAIDAVRHPDRPRYLYDYNHQWLAKLNPWETCRDWKNIEELREGSLIPMSHNMMAKYYYGHTAPLVPCNEGEEEIITTEELEAMRHRGVKE